MRGMVKVFQYLANSTQDNFKLQRGKVGPAILDYKILGHRERTLYPRLWRQLLDSVIRTARENLGNNANSGHMLELVKLFCLWHIILGEPSIWKMIETNWIQLHGAFGKGGFKGLLC